MTDSPDTAAGTTTVPLRFHLSQSTCRAHAVTFGVPFPRGAVRAPYRVAMRDAVGHPLEAAASTTARWPDGSVQWMLVDALLPALTAGPHQGCLIARDAGEDHGGQSPIRARLRDKQAVIEADGISLAFVASAGNLCLTIVDQDRRQSLAIPIETNLTLCDGQVDTKTVDETRVEFSSPVRATIVAHGRFRRSGLSFAARLSYSIDGTIRCDFSVHNPRRARHRHGLWDLGDAGSRWFQDLSTRLRFGHNALIEVRWRAEQQEDLQLSDDKSLKIVQTGSGGPNWNSRNHVNRHGKIPCGPGYIVETEKEQRAGSRAEPLVVAKLKSACLCLAVPEFWQQFPKAIEVQPAEIRLGLFPREWQDEFELQGGERKTSTILLRIVASKAADEPTRLPSFPTAIVTASPDWYEATGVVPLLAKRPADADSPLESLMQAALTGEHSFFAKRETVDEYGWRNFGDVWADHEGEYYHGPAPVISHYNNQFDIVYGAILQLMRTADIRWFDVFDPLARHVVDIDIYQTRLDKPAYNGGLFWFTDHYLEAGTSTHRTYSRANLPKDGGPYGGGPGSEHNFSTGLLYYYYLTGNVHAAEAVLSLADWVVAMDDGRQDLLGIVDDGPTGRASWCDGLDFHGPGRGAANSISVLLDGWVLSRDQRYRAKADELIRRCIHPDDDIDRHELLRAEKRWSYTMFLASLVKYLRLKLEREEIDEMFHYAKQSLIRYADWMERHERPYLDHPDELEYPTEAWAAQELRKANVLQMAALFTPPPRASRMSSKGRALAARAWHDLLAFETRHYTRATALVMVEGTVDAFFRSHPAPDKWHTEVVDQAFDPPREFVPQRTRVMQRTRTVGGIATCVARGLNPARWLRWIDARRIAAASVVRFPPPS